MSVLWAWGNSGNTVPVLTFTWDILNAWAYDSAQNDCCCKLHNLLAAYPYLHQCNNTRNNFWNKYYNSGTCMLQKLQLTSGKTRVYNRWSSFIPKFKWGLKLYTMASNIQLGWTALIKCLKSDKRFLALKTSLLSTHQLVLHMPGYGIKTYCM